MAESVDFSSAQEYILLNPRLDQKLQNQIRRVIKSQNVIKDHFWLMSSGTESARVGQRKMIALSREALLSAAQAVTHTFMIDSSDTILQALPSFHVGGLSIYARSYVSGCKVVDPLPSESWNPRQFVQTLMESKISVASLVPTQVFDLVHEGLTPPDHLRWIFVGGGALDPKLLEKARVLRWPLILTYGMTETCAMIAHTADMNEGAERFPHILDWRSDENGRLSFLSPSLLSAYLFMDEKSGSVEIIDPKVEGWFKSDDCGEIKNGLLFLKGRQSELVKINGETVSLVEVQNLWDQMFPQLGPRSSAIVALPEPRKGFVLVLATTAPIDPAKRDQFNAKVVPFHRLQQVVEVPEIPTTSLGKILRGALAENVRVIITKTTPS